MQIYFAGSIDAHCEASLSETLQNAYRRLLSYHYCINGGHPMDGIQITKQKAVNFFLDSGAFSAWSQNTKVDIHEYIDFIKQHEKYITVYANLDVIKDPRATLQNQRIMEKHGLQPLPVFHIGSPIKYLKYYLKRYEYICLGVAGISNKTRLIPWLDYCFSLVCDEDGYPQNRMHGFAVTGFRIMRRYPWYSVDSTSWVLSSRLGTILAPRRLDGEWSYLIDPLKISVSPRSPKAAKADQHISTLKKKTREMVLEYIEEKGYNLGKAEIRQVPHDYELEENEQWADRRGTVEKGKKRKVERTIDHGLVNDYRLRDQLNAIYFRDFQNALPEYPWPWRTEGNRRAGLMEMDR